MDKIESLEAQLNEAYMEKELLSKMRMAVCPICGSRLKHHYRNTYVQGDCCEYTTIAQIECIGCRCFNYREERVQSAYDSYQVSPVALMARVWNYVARYVAIAK